AAKQQLAQNPTAIDDTQLRQMVLQQLIDQKLQLELAERAKLTVTDAQVTQTITHIAASNHMTLAQMKAELAQRNLSYAGYVKMIHDQMLIHQVEQSAVGNQVRLSPQDTQDALAQYQAQMKTQQSFHVMDVLSSTQDQAQKIMAQLKNGADINIVSPNSTTDLGWQTTNTLPSIFLQQLSNMKAGDVAGPIQAPNGFHVIKLIGVRGQAVAQPNQVQLQNMAYQMKFQQAVKKWLIELRKTAYIKVN
ncbi:MAG: SurA N-terminal domain-containing protein, partial [Gammaproteobacteria bacterium]|nr:SurA N-terminal domain-containing protein [Gammaproteobacteria bacterium]